MKEPRGVRFLRDDQAERGPIDRGIAACDSAHQAITILKEGQVSQRNRALFPLAMFSHTGSILIDFSVTPGVLDISVGQDAARMNGGRACGADMILAALRESRRGDCSKANLL
jgi:hypothetical protein